MIQKFAKLFLYKNSDNIFKIIFIMFHHTLIKYIIIKQIKADLFLSANKNDSITSFHKFQTDKKCVRISKKLKLKKLNIKNIIEYE